MQLSKKKKWGKKNIDCNAYLFYTLLCDGNSIKYFEFQHSKEKTRRMKGIVYGNMYKLAHHIASIQEAICAKQKESEQLKIMISSRDAIIAQKTKDWETLVVEMSHLRTENLQLRAKMSKLQQCLGLIQTNS